MPDITDQVSHRPFSGSCEKCQGPAEARSVAATALIRNKRTTRYAAVGLQMVVCDWEGHRYYVIDWSTEVIDPFAPPAPKE